MNVDLHAKDAIELIFSWMGLRCSCHKSRTIRRFVTRRLHGPTGGQSNPDENACPSQYPSSLRTYAYKGIFEEIFLRLVDGVFFFFGYTTELRAHVLYASATFGFATTLPVGVFGPSRLFWETKHDRVQGVATRTGIPFCRTRTNVVNVRIEIGKEYRNNLRTLQGSSRI